MTERRPSEPVSSSAADGSAASPDNDWQPLGRTLDPQGQLVGQAHSPAKEPSNERPAPAPKKEDEPLELDRVGWQPPPGTATAAEPEPAPPPETTRRPRRGVGKLVVALLLVGAGTGGLWLYRQRPELFRVPNELPRQLPQQLRDIQILPSSRATPVLIINSEPAGATVKIGGRELGETPLALDNTYPGATDFELHLKGYQPYRSTFPGGKEARIEAKLRRK